MSSSSRKEKAKARPYLFDFSFDPEEVLKRRRQIEERRLEQVKQALFAALPPKEEVAKKEKKPEAPPPPPPPPKPQISQAEIATMQRRAYEEGEQEGKRAALAEVTETLNHKIANLQQSLLTKLDDVFGKQEETDQLLNEQVIHLALAAVRKLFPALAQRQALQEVEYVLRECFENFTETPNLRLFVAPDQLLPIKPHLRQLQEKLNWRGTIEAIADPELLPGDCRVSWDKGGVERLSSDIWKNIEEIVTRYIKHFAGPMGGYGKLGDTLTQSHTPQQHQYAGQNANQIGGQKTAQDDEGQAGPEPLSNPQIGDKKTENVAGDNPPQQSPSQSPQEEMVESITAAQAAAPNPKKKQDETLEAAQETRQKSPAELSAQAQPLEEMLPDDFNFETEEQKKT